MDDKPAMRFYITSSVFIIYGLTAAAGCQLHLSQFMSHAELNSLFQQLLWIDSRNSGRLKAIAF